MERVAIVIEDQPEHQQLARQLFQELGWHVYTAATLKKGFQLISAWLDPRTPQRSQVLIVLDLVMDSHGMHLAALVRDYQIQGLLGPATLAVLTAGYSAENLRMCHIAGCDGIYEKPLTRSLAHEIAETRPRLSPPDLDAEDVWLRGWLVREGEHLLLARRAAQASTLPMLSSNDLVVLLKALSGRGWQSKGDEAVTVLQKFGGVEQARVTLEMLLPQLEEPYGEFLHHLLNNASISESGKRVGYCRSHAYHLFDQLIERLRIYLTAAPQPGALSLTTQEREVQLR